MVAFAFFHGWLGHPSPLQPTDERPQRHDRLRVGSHPLRASKGATQLLQLHHSRQGSLPNSTDAESTHKRFSTLPGPADSVALPSLEVEWRPKRNANPEKKQAAGCPDKCKSSDKLWATKCEWAHCTGCDMCAELKSAKPLATCARACSSERGAPKPAKCGEAQCVGCKFCPQAGAADTDTALRRAGKKQVLSTSAAPSGPYQRCVQLRKAFGVKPGVSWGSMPKGNRAEWTQLSCDDQVAAAPSYGRVAFIVRGEAFRLGGRNLDTSQAGGCKKQGAEPQREATQTLLNLMVSPLEARGNRVDMFITETSGEGAPCKMAHTLQEMYQGGQNRTLSFKTVARMPSQADSVRLALDFFKEGVSGPVEDAYDLVLILRHDMVWTMAIDQWPRPADFSKFSFLSSCEKRAGEKCVSDTFLMMPGSMFAAFDRVAGSEGSRCFVASFRHGSGHECYDAISKAIGEPPVVATDYTPRGSVRRANPLGWLIGTPPDQLDVRKMDKLQREMDKEDPKGKGD